MDDAIAALRSYRPSWLDRLLNRVERKRDALEQEIVLAAQIDTEAAKHADHEYRRAYARWEEKTRFAQRVAARDPSTYEPIVQELGTLHSLASHGHKVRIEHTEPDAVYFYIEVKLSHLIPMIEVTQTAAGNLSYRDIPNRDRFLLAQDHLCSCALRVALDAFRGLPIDQTIVNVGQWGPSSVTGHPKLTTLLAVRFDRATLLNLVTRKVDPSDSMDNFEHRMKFSTRQGLAEVEPYSPELPAEASAPKSASQ